jgi:hypothetical protein
MIELFQILFFGTGLNRKFADKLIFLRGEKLTK